MWLNQNQNYISIDEYHDHYFSSEKDVMKMSVFFFVQIHLAFERLTMGVSHLSFSYLKPDSLEGEAVGRNALSKSVIINIINNETKKRGYD